MRVIFDKNTAEEREINLTFFAEQPKNNRFTGNTTFEVTSGSVFPDVSGLVENPDFDTLTIINGRGVEIPTAGEYNTISNVSVTYNDTAATYSVDIMLEYVERAPAEDDAENGPDDVEE